MRTIKTENGQYTIADNRNIEEFIKQLKKPKPNKTRQNKIPSRVFPRFVAGKTSTRDYVRQYYQLNSLSGTRETYDYLDGLFGPLSDNPAPDFVLDDETIEVRVC